MNTILERARAILASHNIFDPPDHLVLEMCAQVECYRKRMSSERDFGDEHNPHHGINSTGREEND